MPKKFKGENSKVTAAKEKKASVQAEKDAKVRAQKEAKEAAEWSRGAKKDSREDEERKKAERLAKKAEAAALLAKEEAEAAKNRAAVASNQRKREQVKPPSAASAPSPPPLKGAAKVAARREEAVAQFAKPEETPEFSASGLDAALELLDLAIDAPSAAANSQSRAIRESDKIDRHPERRAKAAWLAYKERETEVVKKENPGLRLSQIHDVLWKRWQKSPENPFNQAAIAYNATADDERALVAARKEEALDRMRTK
ncbi:hypothetical protein H9P43_005897 [Blastocladiella emersonii ATCC 22665]|nr:hypothetical protein H9P43_005897 [Blastocladiella emersonii ATCC 22665]